MKTFNSECLEAEEKGELQNLQLDDDIQQICDDLEDLKLIVCSLEKIVGLFK